MSGHFFQPVHFHLQLADLPVEPAPLGLALRILAILVIVILFLFLGLAMFDLIQIDFSKYQTKFNLRNNEGGSFLIAFLMAIQLVFSLITGGRDRERPKRVPE